MPIDRAGGGMETTKNGSRMCTIFKFLYMACFILLLLVLLLYFCCCCYSYSSSSFRLDGLLNSQVLQDKIIPRSPLQLRRQTEFSDIILISKEGKSIQCHKCVLVARSGMFATSAPTWTATTCIRQIILMATAAWNFVLLTLYVFSLEYFRSMLLMGWKEASRNNYGSSF